MSQRSNSRRRSASNVSFGIFSGQQQQTQPRAATSTGRRKKKRKPQSKAENKRPTTAIAAPAPPSNHTNVQHPSSQEVPPSRRLFRNSRRSRSPVRHEPLPTTAESTSEQHDDAAAEIYRDLKLKPQRKQRSRTSHSGYVGVQRKRGLDAVISAQRKRGLDAVISAHREYDKKNMKELARKSAAQASKRALKNAVASNFAPTRPVEGQGKDGGAKHRNFLPHANAVHNDRDGVSVVGKEQVGAAQSNITGKVLQARARSIQKRTTKMKKKHSNVPSHWNKGKRSKLNWKRHNF